MAKLQKAIADNGTDEYSYWARLRVGLIQQYILRNLEEKSRPGGFLGMGAKAQYHPYYDEVIHRAGHDAIDAQAIYQEGELLWRESMAANRQPSTEAAHTLEQLIHKGRGSSEFQSTEIYVSQQPGQGFKKMKVGDLRGTLNQPNPLGILDRVNQYYSTTLFYKLFDGVVKLLGDNPAYSYGLALILFAVLTRLALQPLTKKQYDSMKGMQVIAPEMKKIQERYKGKADQQSQMKMVKEIRELQQRHGVNPMMGCGLALVQMPIMIFVVLPFIQHYEAKLELASASFLWIQNLALPDIPLLVIYAASMLISFRLSSMPPTDEQQRQMQMMMSIMMPLLFPFFLLHYPSAFTLYWMVYNVVSTIFQWRMLKAADPSMRAIKSLLGTSTTPAVVTTLSPTDAVPARPRRGASQNVAPKSGSTMQGQLNGAAARGKERTSEVNGAPLSQEEDAFIQEDEEEVAQDNSGVAKKAAAVSQKTAPQKRASSQRARRRRRH